MESRYFYGFIAGLFIGVFSLALLIRISGATYGDGIRDTQKEAFKMGLMTKEIDKDDKVIYRFIETHKLGYE